MTKWRINPTAKTNGRNSLMVESEMGVPIAEVKMQYLPSGRVTVTPDKTKTEQQKNAELIAAAPELLAVAKELLEAIDTHFGIDPSTAPKPGNLRWRVVAAIAKAEWGDE